MNEMSRAELVLLAAAKRFSTRGYHGLSFRDLAKDVGITSASVHYHYPTKSDLVSAIADYSGEQLRSACKALDEDATLSASDKIGSYCDFFMARDTDPQHCRCLITALVNLESIPGPVAEAFKQVANEQIEWLDKTCRDIPGEQDSRRAAKSLMSRIVGQCIMSSTNAEFRNHIMDAIGTSDASAR